jgi:hypothetical protein
MSGHRRYLLKKRYHLKEAKNILGLQLQISILKYEIEELKQIKNNLQHTKNNYTLETLSEINRNYPKYRI